MGFGDGFNKQYPGLENSGSTDIKVTGSLLVTGDLTVLGSSNIGGGGGSGGDALTGSTNIFRADQIISGNLNIDGTITAKQFNVVTSSVLYTSGSTKFGDSPDDTHQFTGSVISSGGFTGSFSGSFIGDGSQLTGLLTSINSSHIIYVNSGSTASSQDGTINKPFKTVQGALDNASSSYTNFDNESVFISIAPGVYNENITIRRHNTYLKSNLSKYEQRGVKINGSTVISCSVAPSKYNHVVGLDGLYLSSDSSTVTASVNVLSPGAYTVYIKDCYLYTTKTNVSALRVSGSVSGSTTGKKIVVKDSSFYTATIIGYAGSIVDLQGGDYKIDTTEIYGDSPSTSATALNIGGDSLVLADRTYIAPTTTTGYAVTNNSTFTPTAQNPFTLTLSNSSISTSGSVVVNTNNYTYLTNDILTNPTTPIISGSSPLVAVYYSELISAFNTFPAFSGVTPVPSYQVHGNVKANTLSGTMNVSQLTGTLPVNKGGTGLATLQTGSILIGNGTGSVAYLSGSASDNGKVVTWVSGAFTLTGSSAAGLNIAPTAEGQTLIASGTSFVAARPIAGSNIGLDFASGSITVKLSSSLDNLTSVSSSWFTGSLKGTAQTASYVNPLTQSVYINGNLSASSGITGSFSGSNNSIASASMINNFVTDVQNISAGSGIRSLVAGNNIGITAGQNPEISLSGTINITNAYLLGEIRAKTGSFEVLNNVSASSVLLGDKYIIIASGASDHYNIDEAGLLWGSGSIDSTRYGIFSSSAAVVYLSQSDTLYAYPRLSSSFTGAFSGNGSGLTNLSVGSISGVVKTVSATAPMTASIDTNGLLSIALNSGSVSFNGVAAALGASGSIPLVAALNASSSILISSSSLSGAVNIDLNKTLTNLTSVSSSWFTGSFSGSGAGLTNVASSLVYASATPALAVSQVVALSGGLVAADASNRLRANAFGVIQASSSAGYIVQTTNEIAVAFSSSNRSLLVTGSEFYVSSSGTASLYEDIAGNSGGVYATQIGYLNRVVGTNYYIIISPRPFGLVY